MGVCMVSNAVEFACLAGIRPSTEEPVRKRQWRKIKGDVQEMGLLLFIYEFNKHGDGKV